MNALLTLATAASTDQSATLSFDYIKAVNQGSVTLDEQHVARVAHGLGIRLGVGDYVAVLDTPEGKFVVALLIAAPREQAYFELPFAEQLQIRARHVDVTGDESVTVRSASDITMECGQHIRLTCTNLFLTALDSMVNVMRHWVSKFDTGLIRADQVLHSDAENHIITANKDLRLDADRINMG
ncbi:hypothetical protein GCM10008090_33710 [Arenicella chitinivorans]|uniref:DUF3540 domain-containing protein n=1 Tax=Arenicella chitinivorans TaxID=1329800 RepID=A0A918S2Q4_9GAMM|nr:hypothetical protein [Arenicella chitinivorans]GHA21025.1 hypothetical protein GCM10008090_33710 [Arenicella chitinivorans]